MKKAFRDKLVLEIDGEIFFMRRRRIQNITDVHEIRGDKWVITDFGSAEPQLISVESPQKYAAQVAQRRMQEQGDITGEAMVFPHWMQSRGQGVTQMMITAMDRDKHTPHENRAEEDNFQELLFSVNSLMLGCLNHYGARKHVAILFQHDRHVDILVGKGGKVLGATRVSAFGRDADAILALADSVQLELKNMAEEGRYKLDKMVYFCWLMGHEEGSTRTATPTFATFGASDDSTITKTKETGETGWASQDGSLTPEQNRMMRAEWVVNMGKKMEVEYEVLKPHMYDISGEAWVVASIPQVLRHLTDRQTVSGSTPLMRYRAQRILPWLALGVWLLAGGLYWSSLYVQRSVLAMEQKAIQLQDLSVVQQKIVPVDPTYKDVLAFSSTLDKLKDAPSLRAIFVELTLARKGKMYFKEVEITYDENKRPVVTIQGMIRNGFRDAIRYHEGFIGSLRSRGYVPTKSDFTTDVNEVLFKMTVVKEGS
ncbi:MAG: hypothetical protein HQL53_05365 [Magnetococcales bacterium]|nr:hypothetical protein [Magnetococcales bacterium]